MAGLSRKPFSAPSVKAMNASMGVFLALFVAFLLKLFDAPGLGRGLALIIMTTMLLLGFGLFGWSMLLQRKEKPLIDQEAIRSAIGLCATAPWATSAGVPATP